MLFPSHSSKTSPCQHMPPPETQLGGLRIKPFNPPPLQPTLCHCSSHLLPGSPPYLIKVSAAAPEECRPGYCIPQGALAGPSIPLLPL